MNELVYTTKGKNTTKKLSLIILGIVAIIGGFAVLPMVDKSSGSMKDAGMVVAAIAACFGLFAILTAFIHVSGYVNIYPDHIEGKGKQGKAMVSFRLSPGQIQGVTIEQGNLCIHSTLGVFKIICSKSASHEACDHINHML